jgi:hypothetical protein
MPTTPRRTLNERALLILTSLAALALGLAVAPSWMAGGGLALGLHAARCLRAGWPAYRRGREHGRRINAARFAREWERSR